TDDDHSISNTNFKANNDHSSTNYDNHSANDHSVSNHDPVHNYFLPHYHVGSMHDHSSSNYDSQAHENNDANSPLCGKPIHDVDYPGNDIAQTSREDPQDCCTDYSNTPGCAAYVWTAWNDGTCFLKSKAGDPVRYEGAVAAKVHNSAPVTPSIECSKTTKDLDFPGNDIDQTNRQNPDDCCADCAKTPGCTAYVWTPWNDGTCFLKSKLDNPTPYKGARASSQKLCKQPQANTDYFGHDIDNLAGSPEDCCAFCRARDDCVGYTHYEGIC
ncbi:hypothetical protein AeMF1_013108, partial [Aphanomyces euteiches]